MIIALDYDRTFTEDPEGWTAFASLMRGRGHDIIGVTMRRPSEASGMDTRYEESCTKIHWTSREGKKSFLAGRGINVDVWVDDSPHWILADSADRTTVDDKEQ